MRLCIALFMLACIGSGATGNETLRQKTLELIRGSDMAKYLNAPVKVFAGTGGTTGVSDEGIYIFQYTLERPAESSEPNVVIEPEFALPDGADMAVFVTHGWIEGAEKDWPASMAAAIAERTDPNQWVCGYFDWSGGSRVITSIHAAQYARDIGGGRLAAAILRLSDKWKHIHLIGHSAGAWVIESAGRKLLEKMPDCTIHLTFLDAYVPSEWQADQLGQAAGGGKGWAEHYYTRDITLKVTEHNLANAHNADLTAVDPLIAEHKFPYRWYLATITGAYERWDEKKETVYKKSGQVEYGFGRSLEAGQTNWRESLLLKAGNKAVRIKVSHLILI